MDDAAKYQTNFIDSATEWLAFLENGLCRFEHAPNDKDLLNEIFRAVHSIKGTSGTVGFENIYLFAHSVEELLYLLRQDNLVPDKKIIDALFGAIDIMLEMLEAHSARASFDIRRGEDWMSEAEKIKANIKVFKHG
jgi:two-component system chemotaxis sensor kinase CheA